MKIQLENNKLQIEFDSDDFLLEVKDLYSRLYLCDDEIERVHLEEDRDPLSGWADDHMSGDLMMKLYNWLRLQGELM
jgi:hypothetical protein